jgi:tRNA pseudouridine38-40 synthase
MQRIALQLGYIGTHYHGWQKQGHACSVQGVLETVLARISPVPLRTVCAGRTDAGVHATGQVVHFDTSLSRAPRQWLNALNAHLPSDIRVNALGFVTDAFHARFSAQQRRYHYVIDQRYWSDVFMQPYVWPLRRPVSIEAMQQAAQSLIGQYDFVAFRSGECQAKTTKREIFSFAVHEAGDVIVIDIIANAFLHHMVRILVGHLVAIGFGHYPWYWLREVCLGGNRRAEIAMAPAQGLHLVGVEYPNSPFVLESYRCPPILAGFSAALKLG